MPPERNSSTRSDPKQDTSQIQEDQDRGRSSSEMMTVSSMGMTDILAHRPHFSPDILDSDGYSISGLSPPIFVSDNNSDSDSPAVVLACSQVEEALHRLSVDYEDLVIRREKMKLRGETRCEGEEREQREREREQLSMLALVLDTLRRSLLSCKTSEEESASMEIGWPTNVRHVTHVTFDRFNGFLGLPVEFEIEIPRRVPSASASVFGVSPESMQCSYDAKGNSVPTILLLMQERLYSQGGLKAEGIFRINAENSHEESVREQLNRGTVPHDIDLHCLAGLIKAWFRELPKGILDSLTPEQVMRCHTEEHCVELAKLLPQAQAALLDWAVNLMADVAQEEAYNKMNARNVAMVFAPNMTQMADPLTALMHAVQVMNFLKTLILRTMRDRQEAVLDPGPAPALATTRGDDDRDDDDSYAGGTTIGTNDDPDSGKFKLELEHEEHQRHHQQQQEQQQPAPARAQAVVVHSKKQQQQQRIKGKAARLINRIDKQSERAEAW